MSHEVVKIIIDQDDIKVPKEEQVWHYVTDVNGRMTLCGGECFDYGDCLGQECKHELKVVKRGGITCPTCLKMIKNFKSIKL